MNIIISNQSGIPIYEQITKTIKEEIIKGNLKENELLPSIRNLAKELRVSVITSKKAYEELEHEGFIYTVKGKGTFVGKANLDAIKDDIRKEIEEKIDCAIEKSFEIGVTEEEFLDMVKILWSERG